jgi:hypothetical protein
MCHVYVSCLYVVFTCHVYVSWLCACWSVMFMCHVYLSCLCVVFCVMFMRHDYVSCLCVVFVSCLCVMIMCHDYMSCSCVMFVSWLCVLFMYHVYVSCLCVMFMCHDVSCYGDTCKLCGWFTNLWRIGAGREPCPVTPCHKQSGKPLVPSLFLFTWLWAVESFIYEVLGSRKFWLRGLWQ